MPEINSEDTIAAIATPIGEGGISVIRLSGESAWNTVAKVFRSAGSEKLEDCAANTIHYGSIQNEEGKLLDQVLLSLFKAPHSYTGEDVIEISSHGGMVVTRTILDLFLGMGIRHAEPGEFTRRAFMNGKIDLTQAEAVLDLIKAKSTLSMEIATKQLVGSLSLKLKGLRESLMKVYAHMEAYVDFPDQDVEVYSNQEFVQSMNSVKSELLNLIRSFKRGSLLREGASIVIIGRPNVGKSSLFNALLERDKAIVSEFEGTTRDLLEENIEVQGVYARLTDTAGLALKSDNPLDKMGVQRTKQAIGEADLYLFVVDGAQSITDQDKEAFFEMNSEKPKLVIVNKSDLKQSIHLKELEKLTGTKDFVFISTKDSLGFDKLDQRIYKALLGSEVGDVGEQVTRLRHKNALQKSLESLERAEKAFSEKESLECVTFELKSSLDALRELIGEVYSEDLLDVIFSEFCIGK